LPWRGTPLFLIRGLLEVQAEGSTLLIPFAAGREVLRRLAEAERGSDSFAIETTLPSSQLEPSRWFDTVHPHVEKDLDGLCPVSLGDFEERCLSELAALERKRFNADPR
jgi:hypothetical protein